MPSTPVASVSPETDARHLHDLASSTAVRLLGFVAQTKKPPLPSPLAPSIQEWTPQLPPGLSSSTAPLRRHSTPVYL